MRSKKSLLKGLVPLFMSICLLAACSQTTEQQAESGYTIDNIREQVVGLDEKMELASGGSKAVTNFDNAATTPALQPVVDAVDEELKKYGSIGRGFSPKSDHSTDLYNDAKDKVLKFVGADPENYTVFYVNNTTDGLNKLASALIDKQPFSCHICL